MTQILSASPADVRTFDRKLAAIHSRASRAERARLRDVMRKLPAYATPAEILRAASVSVSVSVDCSLSALNSAFVSPASLSGLRVWYGADVGVTTSGGVATNWSDQSGNARHLVGGAAGHRPAYSASDANFNGKPTLTGAAPDYMQCTFAAAETMPCDIYVAWKATSNSSHTFFDGIDATHRIFGGYNAANAAVGGTNVASMTAAGAATTNAVVMCFSFNDASSAIYKNNTSTPIVTGSATSVSWTGLTMFSPYLLSQPNNGNTIAELFAADVQNATNRTAAMQWLGTKYGITVT